MERAKEQYVEPAHDDIDDADDVEPEQDQQLEFSRGPIVTYVLTQYKHHVAHRLWEREVITHGLKLKKFAQVPMSYHVHHWIRKSGLLHLSSAYLTMVDADLIYAFVGRWHREANSFHLSFGEMAITLDDVVTLLHISPHGKFFDAPVNINSNNAARAAHKYLGATWEEALCWIYEHLPSICKRNDRGTVPAHLPRACRWTATHVVEGGLMTYHRRLVALLLEDVVFTPYDDDQANHSFVSISMFSEYLRCGGVSVLYLLERCLR
ncbi:serine/threonine-protein phosphatase 7 long form homolog [Cicer arietinum]|uniref:Serine/threonine-protein phosphatase 7 long form homolog n=1 Tax=Cicer arietinum TaxID=3827 RepID=A0A1S2Z8C3_CICAR|nr:serine/threonine-protein phosphatase 7 long form homolog [Cicer arietinum]